MFSLFSEIGLFLSLGAFVIGALGSLFSGKKDRLAHLWASGWAILGSALGIVFSAIALFSRSSHSFILQTSFPLFSISIYVDALAAFFLLIVFTLALMASIYGVGYMRQFYGEYSLSTFGFFFNLFIASLALVITASNGFYFLIAWEIMSLVSYFLVIFERRHTENISAGFIYFVMTHTGTAFIFLSFLLLYKFTDSFDFSVWRATAGNLPEFVKDIIFASALIGFGTKAGVVPLHIWLPRAHAAAPSHISALMSGVMIKMGILMIIRMLIDIIPGAPVWWGLVILILGSISSVIGVLYALSEHDIKKLLAYHSIENIGIILLGIGSALTFSALGLKTLAVIGLIAALYHTMNHAIFKALLFLGAGSVIAKTHTRNIEEYGGLIKAMPYTAFFFLIGAIAISGLPPFNGFVSEWLTFQSLFANLASLSIVVKGVFIIAVASLALTAGLAAACFVKAFGTVFLAKPRSSHSQGVKEESSLALLIPMSILAALTLILGVGSCLVSPALANIANSIGLPIAGANVISYGIGVVNIGGAFASLHVSLVFFALILILLAVFLGVRFMSRNQKVKISRTWDCGSNLTPRMEITATGFSQALIMIFKGILRPSRQMDINYHDADIRYFTKSSKVIIELPDIYIEYIYQPIHRLVSFISQFAKKVQSGNVNVYLLYIFIILIGLLILVVK